ncbi:MAG: 3-phosphoglycerate dehydrogenase [Betaproteobacteria bacterium]|nr:3-phosphoglycerate dehydrogenase [Betaproteobacteria bacterium]
MARFNVLTLNSISARGLSRLPAGEYDHASHVEDPHAILVRSADMHAMDISASVLAIGRAGAGTNNIPVKELSTRGVPVFNAPGANANAVKELVLAGMLMAVRNIVPAVGFVEGLTLEGEALAKKVEEGKKHFSGIELANHTLGVVGLGRIGSLVADAAIKLGMNVVGFDPEITVEAAWSLPSQVRRANSMEELVKGADFVTLHVPQVAATKHLINAARLQLMKHHAVLLNFSREGIVDVDAVLAAIAAKKLRAYVCDFPDERFRANPAIVALPHLGASTREAEDNCAIMVVDQVRDYLEHGNIANAVNFPNVSMPRESPFRIGIANANVPNMLGQISTLLANGGLNIHNMLNKSRGEMAYTLVDVDSEVPPTVLAGIRSVAGVLSVRYLPVSE